MDPIKLLTLSLEDLVAVHYRSYRSSVMGCTGHFGFEKKILMSLAVNECVKLLEAAFCQENVDGNLCIAEMMLLTNGHFAGFTV